MKCTKYYSIKSNVINCVSTQKPKTCAVVPKNILKQHSCEFVSKFSVY
jgi:hypothetical protein